MKAVIFAGGVGTRLWPLSRRKSPKQFEKVIDNKSTLQISVDLLLPDFSYSDIYISTGKEYIDLVKAQLPDIPTENIIGEPSRRDVGPAVALMMGILAKKYAFEPVVVLWSDHLIRKRSAFKKIINSAQKYLTANPNQIVYFGHKPRFPSENLGWIETKGIDKNVGGIDLHYFAGFKYRPDHDLAHTFFNDPKYCWNLGSFASTPKFIYDTFKKTAPGVYASIESILKIMDKPDFESEFSDIYSKIPKIHLDHAISEPMDPMYARVVIEDIGWSDIGAWEALKEALQSSDTDNITHGKVLLNDCSDSLIYNYDDHKMIVCIDLDDGLVINTGDVLLVTKKSSVPKIKSLVESLEGTEHDNLT